jgi:hypothetical protein
MEFQSIRSVIMNSLDVKSSHVLGTYIIATHFDSPIKFELNITGKGMVGGTKHVYPHTKCSHHDITENVLLMLR